jgi:hypothetical protein
MHTAAVFVSLVAAAQLHPANKADPKQCVVVVEELGKVGLRISDAQALANETMDALRDRMGYERVVFEGTYNGQMKLKRMLGGAENQMQEEQMAYFKAAMDNAAYRVRVRFGHKGKRTHWVEVSCRKAKAKPKDTLEKKRFEGTKFAIVRKKLKEALPTFCTQMDPEPVTATPDASKPADTSGPLPPKKKKNKAWTPPPRRE